jgi:titin
MDDGFGGDFTLVLSGADLPEVTAYTASGSNITTGNLYRFYTVSENAVGLSTSVSSIASFRACQAPSGLDPPTRVATTESSVSLSWAGPTDDGGCSITGFALFVADEAAATAAGLTYAEVHSDAVRNLPSLNSFTITDFSTLPTSISVGANLRVQLHVFNQGGFSISSSRTLRVVLAAAPPAPAAGPARDSSATTSSLIRVTYSAPASDGGSPITNYEVQMDDGIGGGF